MNADDADLICVIRVHLRLKSFSPDSTWQRFVLDFAPAADRNFRRFAVSDATLFAVEISSGQ